MSALKGLYDSIKQCGILSLLESRFHHFQKE
jgi:hypothetical protein